jgi:hypothetical protein
MNFYSYFYKKLESGKAFEDSKETFLEKFL